MSGLAYLLKKFPRLSETFILNEILAQERLGRELRVFSRRRPDDEPRHPEFARLRAEVEVLPPSREIDPWETLFAEDLDSEHVFAAVGRLVKEARGWNHPRFASLLAEALFLLRRTAELGITHVHTHFATDSAVTVMLLTELGGPSYSITAHAKDIYRSTVDTALLDRLFARSEFVVTVCDANVRHLAARLGSDAMDRVRRLYNGIDLASFEAPQAGVERQANHVLAVGRLVEKKGFHILLDALAILRDAGRPVTATVIGDGEEREALEAQVSELALSEHVRLAGPQDLDTVRAYMARATVCCLPCIVGADGNRDALPTVLVEALASRLPIVSTPVTGIPEILDGGRAGVLVPEKDPGATARAIADLLDDSTRRAELAEAGRRHAEREFDLDRISRTLGSWFDEVLSGSEKCTSPA